MFAVPATTYPAGKTPNPFSRTLSPPLVCSSVNVNNKNTVCDFERHKHSGDAMRSVLRDKSVVEEKTLLVKRKKTLLAKRKRFIFPLRASEEIVPKKVA